jgi:hypothetical protein
MKQEIPTPVAVAIVVVLLAIVAGVGYWIYTRPEPAPPSTPCLAAQRRCRLQPRLSVAAIRAKLNLGNRCNNRMSRPSKPLAIPVMLGIIAVSASSAQHT